MGKTNDSGRNVAILLGGIAAGIVGSRLLPPVVALISGSRRVRAGEDPFALLIEDHRQILSYLDQMVATPVDSTLYRSRLFLMLKRKLAKHALAEEDVVYPILQTQSDDVAGSKHLYDEHGDMKVLLFKLEDKLKSREDWSDPARSLRDLIRRHVDEEEQTIFPRLREMLSESRLPNVSGQIRREEALIL
jgi:hemerythrin-like domain-containing protein